MQKLLFPNSPKQKAILYTQMFKTSVLNQKCLPSELYKQRHFSICQVLNQIMCFLEQNFFSGKRVKEISKISGVCHIMLSSVLSKLPLILALACSLLTEVLSIAKNNAGFLYYFLTVSQKCGRRGSLYLKELTMERESDVNKV